LKKGEEVRKFVMKERRTGNLLKEEGGRKFFSKEEVRKFVKKGNED